MAEAWRPWADRVLKVFESEPSPHVVACSGCHEAFPTAQALAAHHYYCRSVAVADGASRDTVRSRRHRAERSRTISIKRIPKRELELGKLLYPEADYYKPKTRAECVDGPRPCPFASCKYHLYLDVDPRLGSIKLNFPDLEIEQLAESCCLDVAERGGMGLEEVAAVMNVTRERIRQLEGMAFARIRPQAASLPRAEDFEHRHLPVVFG